MFSLVLIMYIKVSKANCPKKLTKRTIAMFDETTSKTVYKKNNHKK